jgi:hypothetical protein
MGRQRIGVSGPGLQSLEFGMSLSFPQFSVNTFQHTGTSTKPPAFVFAARSPFWSIKLGLPQVNVELTWRNHCKEIALHP